MATLSIDNVKKRFGTTEVIHGVSIDVNDGEFIVIVGPSGCGKSTLLRMVAGLETLSEGNIFISDKKVNDAEPMDRDIAMVFQNYALYPHMSVRQNMAYGLKIQKTPKAEIAEKVSKAADLLQLGDYLDRKPKQLSGGQRQRVAMGRAIVREPAIFLFDEPLSNLDAKLRVQMRLEIKQLQSELGVTSLYVTHDQVEAMTMADRMIVMNNGLAEQIGTPLEVYETPQSLFAAQFIGSPAMNVFDGEIQQGTLTLNEGAEMDIDSPHNGSVKVGMRPEHLQVVEQSSMAVDISYAEPLGATTLLHGKLAGSDITTVVSVPGVYRMHKTDNQSADTKSQTDRIYVRPQHLHLFDSVSGRRIN